MIFISVDALIVTKQLLTVPNARMHMMIILDPTDFTVILVIRLFTQHGIKRDAQFAQMKCIRKMESAGIVMMPFPTASIVLLMVSTLGNVMHALD